MQCDILKNNILAKKTLAEKGQKHKTISLTFAGVQCTIARRVTARSTNGTVSLLAAPSGVSAKLHVTGRCSISMVERVLGDATGYQLAGHSVITMNKRNVNWCHAQPLLRTRCFENSSTASLRPGISLAHDGRMLGFDVPLRRAVCEYHLHRWCTLSRVS